MATLFSRTRPQGVLSIHANFRHDWASQALLALFIAAALRNSWNLVLEHAGLTPRQRTHEGPRRALWMNTIDNFLVALRDVVINSTGGGSIATANIGRSSAVH